MWVLVMGCVLYLGFFIDDAGLVLGLVEGNVLCSGGACCRMWGWSWV